MAQEQSEPPTPDDLREQVAAFEEVAREAGREALSGLAGLDPHGFKTIEIDGSRLTSGHAIDLVEFHDTFASAGRYPADRLPSVMAWAVDLKCQVLVISDLKLGESDYEWMRVKLEEPDRRPNLWRLRKYAQTQYEIVSTRIAWERLMNLIWSSPVS